MVFNSRRLEAAGRSGDPVPNPLLPESEHREQDASRKEVDFPVPAKTRWAEIQRLNDDDKRASQIRFILHAVPEERVPTTILVAVPMGFRYKDHRVDRDTFGNATNLRVIFVQDSKDRRITA